jgi:hypothetical protein
MLLLEFSSPHELRNIENIWYITDDIKYPQGLKSTKVRHSNFIIGEDYD